MPPWRARGRVGPYRGDMRGEGVCNKWECRGEYAVLLNISLLCATKI